MYEQISDFCLSTELISKGVHLRWIQRPGFEGRKMLIYKWIFFGTFLHLAYEQTLLSSLVTIRYEDTIDSIYDLDNSGLPLLVLEGAPMHDDITRDPRPIFRSISKKIILWQVDNGRYTKRPKICTLRNAKCLKIF